MACFCEPNVLKRADTTKNGTLKYRGDSLNENSDSVGQRRAASRIFKGNMRTWTETIQVTDKRKLCNVTNEDNLTN